MASTTVRISVETLKALRELSAPFGEPMRVVLSKAVETYRRQYIPEKANAAYAILRDHPEAWWVEQDERQEWEVTLADGREEE